MDIAFDGIFKDGGSLALKTSEGTLVVNRRIGEVDKHGQITLGYGGPAVSQETAKLVLAWLDAEHDAWYRSMISKFYRL